MKDIIVESVPLKNGIHLKLDGELLFLDSQEFMHKIPERVKDKGRYVVIDMAKLQFVDSAGLGAILYVSEACRMQNQVVQIVNANPQVMNSLRTIQNVGTFELHETVR